MRLTFITDEYSQDLGAACAFACERGMGALELRSLAGKHCLDWSSAECAEIRGVLRESGLDLCVLDSFLFKSNWEEPAQSDQFRRYVEVAHSLGARALRIFAYWRDTAPSQSAVADRIRRVAVECQQAGVRLLVENGTYTTVAQGHELATLLDEIDMDCVAAIWDPGNLRNGGWPEDPRAGLMTLGSRVAHVHVKNLHRTEQGKHYGSLLGGTVDWPEQLRCLRNLGYSGYLSLETHARPDRVFDRSHLDFPGGYSFSDGATSITQALLGELQGLLHQCTEGSTHAG